MVRGKWKKEDRDAIMVFEYCPIRGLIYYTSS